MGDLTVTTAQLAPVFAPGEWGTEIVDVVLAETVTKGQAVYQTSSGTFGVADADAAGKQQFRGIALSGGGAGQAISILKQGPIYGFGLAGMNPDAIAYLSDTAGKLADANGTMTVNVGRVMSLPDANATKVLYITADWLRAWS